MKEFIQRHALSGKFVRKERDLDVTPTPPANAPGVPTNVRVSQTSGTATVTWEPPTSDGGSAITGYRVARVGGTSQDVAATARSAAFSGLTTTTDYKFTVAAMNSAGVGSAVTVTQTNVVIVTSARFPGDPGKGSGKLYWGICEFDKDPEVIGGIAEDSRPEYSSHTFSGGSPVAGSGVRASVIREYSDNLGWLGNGGGVWGRITHHHDKGRLPWVSTHNGHAAGNWASMLNSTNIANTRAIFDYFIARVEGLSKPVWVSLMHEPENQTVSKGGVEGTELEWLAVQREFRNRMTAYANANGGVANYKWKNLAFANCMTANCYRVAGGNGGIDKYIPTAADASLFDFYGVDYYSWHPGYVTGVNGATVTKVGDPTWGGNIIAAVNWAKSTKGAGRGIGIAEWGIRHENQTNHPSPNKNGADRITEFWQQCLDPANNIFCAAYYNSAVSYTNRTVGAQRWMLNNGGTFTYYPGFDGKTQQNTGTPFTYTYNNGRMLDRWVSILKDPKSIHFWDTSSPAGSTYTKPAGATF